MHPPITPLRARVRARGYNPWPVPVLASLLLASIPSPSSGTIDVGPLTIHMYGLMLLAGIAACVALTGRRWVARGGDWDLIFRVAVWGVGFGIVGARLYHVATDWELYFGPGRNPVDALKIWNGGLGIRGAVALGALGAYLVARRRRLRFPALLDALAPGLLVAQAVGRLGNWFNSELFGRPSTLPWGLEIAPAYRPLGFEEYATFHPTFLYELLWNLTVAAVLVWADRRFRLGHGKVFALYVVLYTAGRFWIEALRIDTAERVLGLRLNIWTSMIALVGAVLYLVLSARLRPGREDVVDPRVPAEPEPPANEQVPR